MEYRPSLTSTASDLWNIQDPSSIVVKRTSNQSRSRSSRSSVSSRWHENEPTLPPYDPVQDVEDARRRGKKNKPLSFFALFRYSTNLDKILMFVGALLAIFSGVLIPWIFYWFGKLLLEILLHVRCERLVMSNDTWNSKFQYDISYDFLVNTGYGAGALFVSNYLSWRCFAWAADRQIKTITCTYFEWIIRKDMAWFDVYKDRDFSKSMIEDITKIRSGLGETLPALISLISTEICLAILAFALDYKLALSFCGLAPICLLLGLLGSYAQSRQTEEASKTYEKAGKLAEEILCNIKIVKVFQGESREVSRFSRYLKSISKNEFKWIIFSSLCSASLCFIVSCITAAAIWVGLSTVNFGHEFCLKLPAEVTSIENRGSHSINLNISFPEGPHSFVMVFLAIVSISLHAMDIPYFIRSIMEAKNKAAQVYFLIDWKPRIDNLSEIGKSPKSSAIGRIEVKDVGFRYPRNPDTWVIRNIFLTIYPGQVVGLIGHQSSGKSTILKLLLRLYDPCEGEIIIDGTNTQNFNVRWLRNQIALFTHDPILFPATIEDNLRYVKPNASMDEIHIACKTAKIHERIVDLPNGYQTEITHHSHENELTVSEMRKLCVARAILCKPRIFILDDPMLSNDEELESVLISCLEVLHTHSTIIVTASRANGFIKRCDQIYYFENGKIQEHGTHLQLLKQGGAYYKMIEETLDVVVESKPKFTSQLRAYKFAKSLRNKNKSRQEKSQTLPAVRNAMTSDSSSTNGSFLKVFHRSTNPNTKHSLKQPEFRAYGVGGFQRYSFAKTGTLNPQQVGNLLNKIHGNRKQRDVTRYRTEPMEPSMSGLISKLSIHTPSNKKKASLDHLTVNITGARLSSSSEGPTELDSLDSLIRQDEPEIRKNMNIISKSPYNTDWNADNISVCSQDSQEFWDNYCDKLESINRLEAGTWCNMLQFGGHERTWIALGCLSSIVMGFSVPCCAILIAKMFVALMEIDQNEIHGKYYQICYYFILLGIITGVAAFGQEIFFSIAGKKMCFRLRCTLFASMLKQNLEWYDSTENDISVLCSRLASDTDCLQHVLLTTYGVVFQNATIFLASVGLAFGLYPQNALITLWLLGAAPITIGITYFSGRLLYNQIDMMDSLLAETSELSYVVVSSIRSCIILGLERYFMIRYKKCLRKPFRYFYIFSELRCHSGALARSLPWLISTLFIYNSFRHTTTTDPSLKHYNDPDYNFIIMVTGLMIFGLMNVGESLALLTDPEIGKAAAHRILKILDTGTQNDDEKEHLIIRDYRQNLLPPKIHLMNIGFKYTVDQGIDALHGINLEIQPNSYIAIVGPGHSGKTTLANIILRLAVPTRGILHFDHDNANNIHLGCIKKIMALVEQDSGMIYDKTILENIKYGDNTQSFSEEDVYYAARAAKVHSEIMRLPNDYKTKVNDLGSSISMYAMTQRIALARALIRNPKILIIDDALSSIDNEHEEVMKEAIENAQHGRTLIVFSHKIQPIRDADMIYVMNDGEIIEYGDDSHLLDLQGLYYNMYTAQRLVEAANELQSDNQELDLEEEEVIDILRQKALSSKASRKSTIAYTRFLSEQMDTLRARAQEKNQAMKEETAQAAAIESEVIKKISNEKNEAKNGGDNDKN